MVGNYIKLLRGFFKYSQVELSNLSGVNLNRIRRYEQGNLKSLNQDEHYRIYLSLGAGKFITNNRPKSFKELYFDVIETEQITLIKLMELTGLDERKIRDTLCYTSNIKVYNEPILANRLGFHYTEESNRWESELVEHMDPKIKEEYLKSLELRYERLAKSFPNVVSASIFPEDHTL